MVAQSSASGTSRRRSSMRSGIASISVFRRRFFCRDLFLVLLHRLPRQRGKESRKIGISGRNLLVGDTSGHAEEHRPLRIDRLRREVEGIGDELEDLFGTDGGDFLVPFFERTGNIVVEAFLLMPCELLDCRAALLRPFFVESTAEGVTVSPSTNRTADTSCGELRDDVSGLVVGLDAELLSVLAVLAEQEPCKPVEDRGLADAVPAVNLGQAFVELDRQIAQPLEIEEPDFFDDNLFIALNMLILNVFDVVLSDLFPVVVSTLVDLNLISGCARRKSLMRDASLMHPKSRRASRLVMRLPFSKWARMRLHWLSDS